MKWRFAGAYFTTRPPPTHKRVFYTVAIGLLELFRVCLCVSVCARIVCYVSGLQNNNVIITPASLTLKGKETTQNFKFSSIKPLLKMGVLFDK